MKKSIAFSCYVFIILFVFLMSGCTKQKQAKLIEAYVSTNDGVISDLNFKMIKLEEMQSIKASDSIVFFVYGYMPISSILLGDSIKAKCINKKGEPYNLDFSISLVDTLLNNQIQYKTSTLSSIDEINETIKKLRDELENNYNPYVDYPSYINRYQDLKTEMLNRIKNEIEVKIQNLESAKKYSQMPNETILLRAFDCTYSIFNPLLQVKQTQTRTFYFDKELTRVVQ